MEFLVALFLFVLQVSPLFGQTTPALPQGTTDSCPAKFAQLQTEFTELTPWDLLHIIQQKEPLADDPRFVDHVANEMEKALTQKGNEDITHAWSWMLKDLLAKPANHARFKALLKRTLARIDPERETLFDGMNRGDFFGEFCKTGKFQEESDELIKRLLAAIAPAPVPGGHRIFELCFRHIGDRGVRNTLLNYYRSTLPHARQINGFVQHQPPIPEFKDIPIALGFSENLHEFTKRTGTISYMEWDYYGWTENAKALSTFGKNFRIMADQTKAIHFDLGEMVKDKAALKRAIKNVAEELQARGEQTFLENLQNIHKEALNQGEKPKLDGGQVSTTNLELYWILSNPDWLAKTIFYVDGVPLSPGDVRDLTAYLDILQ